MKAAVEDSKDAGMQNFEENFRGKFLESEPQNDVNSQASDDVESQSSDDVHSQLTNGLNSQPSNGNDKGGPDNGPGTQNGVREGPWLDTSSVAYDNLAMVGPTEREFILEYAGFLSNVPRKIKRAVNVYGVTKRIAESAIDNEAFTFPKRGLLYEKLFILTLLQESFPYRTSWLVFMAICANEEKEIVNSTNK